MRQYISCPEFARRSGFPLDQIRKWNAKGKFKNNEAGRILWPECKKIFEQLEGVRVAADPANIIPPADDENEESNADESEGIDRQEIVANVSMGEMILKELQKRVKGADSLALQWGKALNEVAKAKKHMLDLLEREGKVLYRNDVVAWVRGVARQNRDVWMNWPQHVAVEMAHEIGVDPKLLHDVLLAAVRKQLERVATLPSEYKEGDGVEDPTDAKAAVEEGDEDGADPE